MKVLMFGWEFPPHILGGLGTASYGLTKGMSQQTDMDITFCIPKPWGDEDQSFLKIIGMNSVPVVWREVDYEYVKHRVGSYMAPDKLSLHIYETEHPDVLLWAVWTVQQYAKMQSAEEARNRYADLLRRIITYYLDNKHPQARLHDNGLLHTDSGRTQAVTWMNAMVYGKPVTPRSGYIVELNTLWYNALMFIADLLSDDEEFGIRLRDMAQCAAASFIQTFLNKHGYLFDYVDGENTVWSVRPNMIFAVAFDYSPLNRKQQKGILDIVTRELLTPKGIRSLSPKSTGYNPNYTGAQSARDYAYHQGTAWPWLSGFYFEAYLKLNKLSGVSFVERQLIGFEDEMSSHCIGTLAELFDGNPPFKGRGAVSFAMNVAEILRTLYLLDEYDNY